MPSSRFGDYLLLARIHIGKSTEIFKASRIDVEDMGRYLTVKRLLPDLIYDDRAKARLKEEARIAVQLTHGNISQVLDSGEIEGVCYIASEYVNGKDLWAIFLRQHNRAGRLPLAIPCFIAMEVCEGLHYLHEKKNPTGAPLDLVHCAVAPRNILVSYDGQVKIIDFGATKSADRTGDKDSEPEDLVRGYMSPEQVQRSDLDRRSDVFCVGICLYELLTGERLFSEESDFSTLQQMRNVDIVSPREVNRQVPEELERIVLKALARDRGDRYQTALELHDALQAFAYESRQLCGRKELGDYLRDLFANEVAGESSQISGDGSTEGAQPRRDDTGLIAFEDLEPQPVTALTPMAAIQQRPAEAAAFAAEPVAAAAQPMAVAAQPMALAQSAQAVPQIRPRYKATLLGVPSVKQPDFDQPGEEASTETNMQAVTAFVAQRPSKAPPSAPRYATPVPSEVQARPSSRPPGPAIAPRPPQPDDSAMEDEKTSIYSVSSVLQEALQPVKEEPELKFIEVVPPAEASTRTPTAAIKDSLPQDWPRKPLPFRALFESARQRLERTGQKRPSVLAIAAAVTALLITLSGLFMLRQPEAGMVNLSTSPEDTLVKVDGQPFTGTSSPFIINGLAPDTPHQIEVSKEGYSDWVTVVELKPGQQLSLPPVVLDAITAEAPVARATPPAKPEPQPPPEPVAQAKPAPLPAAPIAKAAPERTTISHREHRTKKAAVPTVAAIPRQPKVSAAPTMAAVKPSGMGTLRINTRPWSQVYLDNRLIGNTPQLGIPVTSGKHTLTLANPTFGIRKTISLKVAPGETVTKVLTLTPGG